MLRIGVPIMSFNLSDKSDVRGHFNFLGGQQQSNIIVETMRIKAQELRSLLGSDRLGVKGFVQVANKALPTNLKFAQDFSDT